MEAIKGQISGPKLPTVHEAEQALRNLIVAAMRGGNNGSLFTSLEALDQVRLSLHTLHVLALSAEAAEAVKK